MDKNRETQENDRYRDADSFWYWSDRRVQQSEVSRNANTSNDFENAGTAAHPRESSHDAAEIQPLLSKGCDHPEIERLLGTNQGTGFS